MSVKKIFREIPKSMTEKIIVALTEWHGSAYVDIRLWYDASNGRNTDWKPSKKGIAIKQDFLKDLRDGIDSAILELIGEGDLA